MVAIVSGIVLRYAFLGVDDVDRVAVVLNPIYILPYCAIAVLGEFFARSIVGIGYRYARLVGRSGAYIVFELDI
ncbi:hypothetical protein DHW03_05615 [Pedobacter yonginense]|uniref:Uncharacterized protein n=1 Tax=Pedobacter yonginense TaxID=651869 RepID=A0A317ERH6_9SPHI|nr:hypothetical protein DHW03_05615 [Pedobacter yonginense]